MDINTWRKILDVDEQELRDSVENARKISKDSFAEVVLELAEKMVDSEEFSATVSALIVGNLAFEMAPVLEMELASGCLLSVRIDQR